LTCREETIPLYGIRRSESKGNVRGRGDVQSCHKVNVSVPLKAPAGSSSVVYVVRGGPGGGPRPRTTTKGAAWLPSSESPPPFIKDRTTKWLKYVYFSKFTLSHGLTGMAQIGPDRVALSTYNRGGASDFFASETKHRILRGQSGNGCDSGSGCAVILCFSGGRTTCH
jgi:hypothetical protein